MGFQNIRNLQEMNLVLSSDAKPRLKWIPELHQRFVNAVHQLGGADKATPKSLMKEMKIPGLTLYHLKSHLQKYRLGKNHLPDSCDDSTQEDSIDSRSGHELFDEISPDPTMNYVNESLQLAETIQLQMEVQRKLHEQIEVQRHLQLRIETQARYLQKVLKKAQDTLSASTSSPTQVENAEPDLSQLVSSMVSSDNCLSFSLSGLTESREALSLHNLDKQHQSRAQACSLESSLTSETSSRIMKEDIEQLRKVGEVEETATNKFHHNPVILQLLDQPLKNNSSTHQQPSDRKRRKGSSVSEEGFDGDLQSCSKRVAAVCREKMGSNPGDDSVIYGTIDLNNQVQSYPAAIGRIQIDLNSSGTDE